MAKIDEATLGLYFSKLMTSKLGAHLDWEKPVLDNFAGPYDPAAFSPYDNKRQQIVDECRAKLATYSDSSISVLINRSKDDPNDVVKEWRNFKVNEIYDLDKRKPPWYAGGFGHPKYVADFDYWAQSRFFTNHEALLLSLGVEPKHFDEKSIVTLSEKMRRGVNLWEPLVYMVRRREQIERHFFRAVHQNKIDPKALFEWFTLVSLEVHPDFGSRYVTIDTEKENADNRSEFKRPHQREIDSVCQLFAAMAVDYYGYDPKAARSPIPKEIAELVASMGIEMSEDTIRKYLRKGASFISDEWKPK